MAERKLATVLFADLVGSTELGASQDPERVRALLDRFYDAMAAEVEGAGGTVEKFAGDAVMAAFGVPAALEDHAERALHAALSMQRRLAAVFGDALSLRVGVNTGEVVVGRPREGSSFVTGDAVNVAARLEQAADPGEVLVGERTAAAVRGAFEFDEPRVVEAKGKPEGIPARTLVRALTLLRPRGVGGLHQVFVGRDTELEHLLRTYRDTAAQRRPKLVTVVGDAGVGKSRLARELWQRLDSESPAPLRRTGRCLAYGRGITYWPLGEVLKEHMAILEGDTPDEIRERLGSRQVLGLTLGLDLATELHPLAARDRLHEGWIQFLDSLAAERPVVVLVEDIHWAEDPLLDLLERLVRDVDGALLLVATARPDFAVRRSVWGTGRFDHETIWLEPLAGEVTGRLVDELLAHNLPAVFRDRLVETTEGNPFFVEEILATLVDRGLLARSKGRWTLREVPADFALPDSVHAVLAARVDLLPQAEKDALQAAAVIGRTFWTSPLYELLAADPDLRVLEDRDFIRRRAGTTLEGEVEYAFKHALTRDVAYDGLTKARRAHLHARFAQWLERVGEARGEHASLLAYHHAEAVRPDSADLAWAADEARVTELRRKATHWLRRAGELALGRYELDEAIALLSRALDFDPAVDERVAIYRALGEAHSFRYDGEAFWTAMKNALDLCDDPEQQAELYMLLVRGTSGRAGMWRQAPSRELVAGWVGRALELSEPDSPTHLHTLIGGYWFEIIDSEQADRAASVLVQSEDGTSRAHAFDTKKLIAFRRSDYDEALHWADAELQAADESDDPEAQAFVRESTTALYALHGRFDVAERLAQEHQDLAERISPHHRLHAVALRLELEELRYGWEHALDLLPATRNAIAENLDTPCIRNARSLLVTAAAAASLGDETRARELEAEADAVATQGYESLLRAPRLRIALARDDIDTVRRLCVSPLVERRQIWFWPGGAIAYLDALGVLGDRARAEAEAPLIGKPGTLLEPFALRALARVRGDDRLMARAAERFDALGLTTLAAQTRLS